MGTKTLSDLQLAVMRVLWDRGEATVAEVHEALRKSRGLALTSIATILARLEKQGIIVHRALGRQFVYRPIISEQEVRRSMVAELIERLFSGDSAALVSHLVQESEISEDDLAQVNSLLANKENRKRR